MKWISVFVLPAFVALAALGQTVFAALYLGHEFSRLPKKLEAFSAENGEASPENLLAESYRAFRSLSAEIPEGAKLLILSDSLAPISYEYFFHPWKARYLIKFSPEVLPSLEQLDLEPLKVKGFREWYEFLEEGGLRRTPERLAQALEEVDTIVTFRVGDDVEIPPSFVRVKDYGGVASLFHRPEKSP